MDRQDKLKSSLLKFLNDLFDLMVLNWFWMLCCIPIITIGPATCAMYSVTLKLVRDEPVSLLKDFFRGFRENFKTGLVLGLAAVVLLVVAAGDAWFALQQVDWLKSMYLVIAVIIGVIWLIFISYTFALQAMFRAPLKVQILNAFKLTFVAPGKAIGIWLLLLLPVILALVLPPVALKMLGFLYLAVGISGPVYFASRIQRNVFDRVNGSPVVEGSSAAEK